MEIWFTMIKVLNLYAGIGGNRKLWENVQVIAVENNTSIARVYKEFYPDDKVIITDAHKFLIDHFKEYDFIWSSPPCPTHSRINHSFNTCGKNKIRYADLKLYEEVILLQKHGFNPWVVENVIPYYEALRKPSAIRGRHMFWSNFHIQSNPTLNSCVQRIKDVTVNTNRFGFELKSFKLENKRQILRNLVDPKLGLHVFNAAFKERQEVLL